MTQMQQVPYAWSGSPTAPQRAKHRLDEVDDLGPSNAPVQAGNTGAGRSYSTGVTFSDDNLQAANAFVAAAKRRKSNTGKVALPPDLEPQFESLSLRNLATAENYTGQSFHPEVLQTSPVIEELPSVTHSSPARGRYLHTNDSPRGRRDGTPTVTHTFGNSSSHRKRSSSRNRARKSNSSSDADMKPAPRYDPARPHVVFVDTLSDSDEENDVRNSEAELTSDDLSALSTPGNSPSSSDAEENVTEPPLRGTSRPIQMNKRLREHLRKQAMMQRLGHKPMTEGMLASAAPTTGGAGIHERGLVLYRPLSWGIVEEPEEDERGTTFQHDDQSFSNGVRIQELPTDDVVPHVSRALEPEVDGMEIDQEMEIDQ